MRKGAVAALTISLIIVAAVGVLVLAGWSKDYSGLFVADLPLSEQVKVARCVRLSSVVNWGEGGATYCRRVAAAFLLDYPFPDFLDEKYGRYVPGTPWEEERAAIAFLTQNAVDPSTSHDASMPRDVLYVRYAGLFTRSSRYSIYLLLNGRGNIVRSWSNFLPHFRQNQGPDLRLTLLTPCLWPVVGQPCINEPKCATRRIRPFPTHIVWGY